MLKNGLVLTVVLQWILKMKKLSLKEKEKVLSNASNICNRYSIDNFYHNIMEVYKRAQRKYW